MNIHVVMLTRAHFDNDTKLVAWAELGLKRSSIDEMSHIVLMKKQLSGKYENENDVPFVRPILSWQYTLDFLRCLLVNELNNFGL